MTDLERRALMGDKKAQEECTEKGIVLPCPLCGKSPELRHVSNDPILKPYAVCCGGVNCRSYVMGNTHEEAIRNWNARPSLPIGRCGECKHSTEPSHLTTLYGEPGTLTCHYGPCNRRNVNVNDYCSYFEPRCEE